MQGKNPFEYVAPTPASVEQITHFRNKMKELHDEIVALPMPGREKALALTKLEECSMWLNKHIVFNEQ